MFTVFFGPSMDMSFNIYDQRFRMIESISHEERVILGCHYDVERDLLIMSGGSGKKSVCATMNTTMQYFYLFVMISLI